MIPHIPSESSELSLDMDASLDTSLLMKDTDEVSRDVISYHRRQGRNYLEIMLLIVFQAYICFWSRFSNRVYQIALNRYSSFSVL